MEYLNVILSIVSGLVVCIPLVIKLVEYVQATVRSKNWNVVLKLLVNLMEEAEELYSTGAEKKSYVMAALGVMAENINFDLDMGVISDMIDSLCALTKEVNNGPKCNMDEGES